MAINKAGLNCKVHNNGRWINPNNFVELIRSKTFHLYRLTEEKKEKFLCWRKVSILLPEKKNVLN